MVSYLTKEPAYDQISGLTYATTSNEHKEESRASWSRGDVVTSGLVFLMIILAYLYFTG